jgi:hypothetical protein
MLEVILTVLPELCYTLDYVEENERDTEAPWSPRQTGVYQQVAHNGRSVFILIQRSREMRTCVENTMVDRYAGRQDRGDDPMYLHAALILATVDNWGGYIDHLSVKLGKIVSMADYSYHCG